MPIRYDDGLFDYDDKVRINSPGSVVHDMIGTITDFEDDGVYVRFATVTPAMMGYEDARRGLVYITDPNELVKVTEEPPPAPKNWLVILFRIDLLSGTEELQGVKTVESVYGPFEEAEADTVSSKILEWTSTLTPPLKQDGVTGALTNNNNNIAWRCHITQLEKLPYEQH